MATSLRDVLATTNTNSVRQFLSSGFFGFKTKSLIDGIKQWQENLEKHPTKGQSTIIVRVQKHAPGLPGEIENVLLRLFMPKENFSTSFMSAIKIDTTHFEALVPLDSALHGDWAIECEVTMKFVNHANSDEQALLKDTFSAEWPTQDSVSWTILVAGSGFDSEGDPQYVLKFS